jgi:short-subunit dehydrogenase
MKMKNGINYYTLVTGSSSGIGKALAEECAKRGRNLFLISLPGTNLPELAKSIENDHDVKVEYLCIDLREADSTNKVWQHSLDKNIEVDLLINNAGIGYAGNFENLKQEEIDEMINLNIRVLTSLTRLFLPELKKRQQAYILNVGSFGAYVPTAYKSVYLASKSYVYYFSEALRSELNGGPVKIGTLMPSGVLTNGHVKERIKKSGALGRVSALSPEYVASYSLKKLLAGGGVIIPGKITRSIHLTFGILPSFVTVNTLKKVFEEKEK